MISLYDILEASNGQLFGEPAAQIFTDFCVDSSHAREAQLYVALRTDHGDTHQYIREAVEKGALGILCTHPPDFDTEGLSVIMVRDTAQAMMSWAHFVLGKLGTSVVGVAGTSGKSLTVEAIRCVLSMQYGVHVSGDTAGGRLVVPLALAQLAPEHQLLVLELDATQPGEMAEIVQAARPDVGVITHIGHDHMDAFSTPEQIAQEKSLLVEYLSPTGLAVLNYDDDLVRAMASLTHAPVMTVGMERFGADLMAYNILVGPAKTGFDLRYGDERFVGRWTPLLGRHQLYCALAALAVGLHYSVPLDEGLRAITDLMPLPGRMNRLDGINGAVVIDDSYNANPHSTLAALDWLKAVAGDKGKYRTIFVMGDMDKLGSYSQRGHRMVGQRAAEVANVIVTEGTEAALVSRAALDQGMERKQVAVTYSVHDALAVLRDQFHLTNNDIVLVKGGPTARMELVVQGLLNNEEDTRLLPRQEMAWDSSLLVQSMRPSWVEVDLGALADNVRALKKHVGKDVTLMAVVKADGYGHGALGTSITALANGAEYLGVASIYEALELRDAGIDAPILVMSYTPVYSVRQAIRQDITLTVYDLDLARAYEQAAREINKTLRVHVKVDTGMGRLGIMPDEAVPFFRHLVNLRHLQIEGVYTHFSSAADDEEHTANQLAAFKSLLKPLRASGLQLKYTHAANSAATLSSKDTHFNMVRVGLALYGMSPSESISLPRDVSPVLTWKTVVAQVKTLPAGHPVGYGNTYVTRSEERIAIIPVGYADGFRRAPNQWGEVLIHGHFAPIVGRVSMEKTAINVTGIPDATIGDEVVLLGRQGSAVITADDIARRLGTINYEVVTNILPRVPRR